MDSSGSTFEEDRDFQETDSALGDAIEGRSDDESSATGFLTQEFCINAGVRSLGSTPCSDSCSIIICSISCKLTLRYNENFPYQQNQFPYDCRA